MMLALVDGSGAHIGLRMMETLFIDARGWSPLLDDGLEP